MIELDKSDDGLWTVTLNRPDKANSLTYAMLTELADIAEGATEARALVLTGRGKAFSAGMDLEAAKSGLPTDPVWERLSAALSALPCLTIAALNGTVAGGAMGMVLACDLRIAVPGTRMFYPVMKLGFLPQPSDPGRLTRLIGPSRAKMILMAGQKIDTETAHHWGLIDQVTEPDALLDTARTLAADVLGAAPDHTAGIKHLCRS
ncbi:enoyl-CoA hydratase/isomerase family protein [Roseovarius sp. SK2]|uniref:enoyl-CoA hydratase/isomerase family protein n=1 Tax=Roseovarius TaxID=74030 RepID=UPI00237BDDD9|nr:enoyl-CoA hydratase/isomerase family protein [Roseovarius sp. SK2]MDD9725054.1 enoyl-CoA hydratase/isomerase family protein [Roseovarius sp. SK2]